MTTSISKPARSSSCTTATKIPSMLSSPSWPLSTTEVWKVMERKIWRICSLEARRASNKEEQLKSLMIQRRLPVIRCKDTSNDRLCFCQGPGGTTIRTYSKEARSLHPIQPDSLSARLTKRSFAAIQLARLPPADSQGVLSRPRQS